jgi:DMSO/TMAO reductase YedYZ molybdopterin-dependent catalytic subunit
MYMKNKYILLVAAIGLLCVLQGITGCLQQQLILDAVEIREYQGEKLSSVNDFKENSIKGIQHINTTTYRLNITGLISKPQSYTYTDILENFTTYKKVVTLHCVEGWTVTILWEGLRVDDLINSAEPDQNATTIIFHAIDGYTTSLPREEVTTKNILLAYKMNNVTLPPERGFPFQLVAENKWGYKWIKWVTEIELSDNPNYRGYWEQRGYSNTANQNDSFFKE